ncbi:ATP-binding protein [Microbacterium oryzae]|uniref:ATP-binding protein n=1 Tax=Microbacterium oryzae TaxID=743009 RepID=A0A6I6DSH3_9MICO|nr:ATP-binding protein [Microbacterium oryzae]QGU27026.1 ATP-binding protein [Microbacterium oryzae]
MSTTWADDNRRYTAAAFRRVRGFLVDEFGSRDDEIDRELDELEERMSSAPALTTLEAAFGLSPFERDVLLLCAGVELDEGVRIALAEGDERRSVPAPTFALALAKLPHAHWSALTPAAPLRRWDLVEVAAGRRLTEAPLHVGERVLHYLAGIHYLDDAIGMRAPTADVALSDSRIEMARAAAEPLADASPAAQPVVQLVVQHLALGEAVAAELAASVGLAAGVLPASDLPIIPADLRDVARSVEREAVLAAVLPVVLVDESDADVAARLADEITGPVVIVTRTPVTLRRSDLRVVVPASNSEERLQTWATALGSAADDLPDEVQRAADLLDLDPLAIRAAASEFAAVSGDDDAAAAANRFWTLARDRARPRLGRLAERISRNATWDDLVLPDEQKQTLRDIAEQARWRGLVHREWGLGRDTGEGMGISALFAGPSGTGKTMAASVIATELGLDLYRVDLSQVVSKYIGETEKHLAEIFRGTEGAGCVLLFDEADALFGRRSEVRDSHDRYANLEVSYLLQRMEAYEGLAILTTNMRSALDPAFLRRLRFVVAFTLPDEPSRAEIWRKVYPEMVPREDLDPQLLAQLAIPGGNIRTIALNAAFHAAARGGDVTMADILRATRAEFVKLERALPEAQVRGWT